MVAPVTAAVGLPVRVWLPVAVGVPVTAVGTSVMVIPAFLQRASTAGASRAISFAEHLLGTQELIDEVMLSRPVVHWHFVSVREHPDAGTAAAKQGIAQVGTPDKSCAETKATEAAKAKMEKANFMIAELCFLNEGEARDEYRYR